MGDKLKYTGGILSQIMKEGNVVKHKPFKDITLKEWEEAWKNLEKLEEKRKKQKPTAMGYMLLALDDESFKFAYNDDSIVWLCGTDVFNAIEKRAKKLGL